MAPLVTNAGKAIITNRLIGAGTEPKFIGWGTGATAEAVSQTNLVTPGTEARVTGTSARTTVTATNDTYQVTGTVVADGTKSIKEVGLFDAAGTGSPPTGGNLFMRGLHGSTDLGVGESIAYTITVQFT